MEPKKGQKAGRYRHVNQLQQAHGRWDANETPYWCVHHGMTVSMYHANRS